MTGRKVRDDFVGVIYLPGGVKLAAGDEIPDDAQVGAHVTGEDEATQDSQEAGTALVGEHGPELDLGSGDGEHTSPDGDPAAPRGNASLEAWQEYAKSKGATDEDLDGKSRDEVRDLYAD